MSVKQSSLMRASGCAIQLRKTAEPNTSPSACPHSPWKRSTGIPDLPERPSEVLSEPSLQQYSSRQAHRRSQSFPSFRLVTSHEPSRPTAAESDRWQTLFRPAALPDTL